MYTRYHIFEKMIKSQKKPFYCKSINRINLYDVLNTVALKSVLITFS